MTTVKMIWMGFLTLKSILPMQGMEAMMGALGMVFRLGPIAM
jgi:hypothetical protein